MVREMLLQVSWAGVAHHQNMFRVCKGELQNTGWSRVERFSMSKARDVATPLGRMF